MVMLKHSVLEFLMQRTKTFSSRKFIGNLRECIIYLKYILKLFLENKIQYSLHSR